MAVKRVRKAYKKRHILAYSRIAPKSIKYRAVRKSFATRKQAEAYRKKYHTGGVIISTTRK